MVRDLTPREKEILCLLKNDPMISQEDLAERLTISRSAAAVHISNLIKKGAILGRGYVFDERQGIVVAGSVFFRTESHGPQQPLRGCSSGPISAGIAGIAFQVACRLAEELPLVRFVGVVGRDEQGEKIVAAFNKAGVDTAQIKRNASLPSAQHLEIQWPGGSQCHFDHRIYEASLTDALLCQLELFKKCDLLVLDDVCLVYLAAEALAEISAGSATVAIILDNQASWPEEFIQRDNLFYITTATNSRLLADKYLLANLILMLPGKGVRIYQGGQAEDVFCLPGQVNEKSWSFAAFSSGFISGLSKKLSLRQSARLAMRNCAQDEKDHREKIE